ncbi:hypothetical protein [Actibacterium sp. D379-3]
MKTPLLAALSAVLVLSACDTVRNSRANPFNWFGGSTEDTVTADIPGTTIIDDRPQVDQVTGLSVDKVPGGAVVTAIGLPPRQGYWAAELLAENDGKPVDGVLTYQFLAYPPATATTTGSEPSREVTAGTFVSDQSLANVTTIVVKAARNQRSSRR